MANHKDEILYKVAICGPSFIGKTHFCNILENISSSKSVSPFPHTGYTPTIGVDLHIVKTRINETFMVKAHIWDLGGDQKYMSITTTYLPGCDGIILMLNLESENILDQLREWANIIQLKNPYRRVKRELLLIQNTNLFENTKLLAAIHKIASEFGFTTRKLCLVSENIDLIWKTHLRNNAPSILEASLLRKSFTENPFYKVISQDNPSQNSPLLDNERYKTPDPNSSETKKCCTIL